MPTAGWRLRQASPEDVDALLRLRLALFEELEPDKTREGGDALVDLTRRFLQESLPTGRFVAWLVETDAGDAVACSGLSPFDRPPSPGALEAREGYILNMYTAPAWRGRGLARAMMEALIAHARAAGYRKLWLHTSPDGRALYESLGFEPNPIALEWHP